MSSDTANRDIYIEDIDIYQKDLKHSPKKSILIMAGNIKHIEFIPYDPKE